MSKAPKVNIILDPTILFKTDVAEEILGFIKEKQEEITVYIPNAFKKLVDLAKRFPEISNAIMISYFMTLYKYRTFDEILRRVVPTRSIEELTKYLRTNDPFRKLFVLVESMMIFKTFQLPTIDEVIERIIEKFEIEENLETFQKKLRDLLDQVKTELARIDIAYGDIFPEDIKNQIGDLVRETIIEELLFTLTQSFIITITKDARNYLILRVINRVNRRILEKPIEDIRLAIRLYLERKRERNEDEVIRFKIILPNRKSLRLSYDLNRMTLSLQLPSIQAETPHVTATDEAISILSEQLESKFRELLEHAGVILKDILESVSSVSKHIEKKTSWRNRITRHARKFLEYLVFHMAKKAITMLTTYLLSTADWALLIHTMLSDPS